MQTAETNTEAAKIAESQRMDAEALQRMTAEVKKQLKKLSKNDLIRVITAQLIDLHVMRTAFSQLKEQTDALTKPEATNA